MAFTARAFVWASAVSPLGRPPTRPLARAAARPALVRSRIKSRSNSASDANRLNTRRPCAVVVSMATVARHHSDCGNQSHRRPGPLSWKSLTGVKSSFSDLPSRSSFQTITVSFSRRTSNSFCSWGRSLTADTFSWKIF